MEGKLLDTEQNLIDVQLQKLHPLYTRHSDIGTEEDFVRDVLPDVARRERAHLRAIVLAKGLIMRIVSEHAAQIGKALYAELEKGMRCLDTQGRRVIAVANNPKQEASYRAVEDRKMTQQPYYSAYAPVGSERSRKAAEVKSAQKAFELAEANSTRKTGGAAITASALASKAGADGTSKSKKQRRKQRRKTQKLKKKNKNLSQKLSQKKKKQRPKRTRKQAASSGNSSGGSTSASGGLPPRACRRCGSLKHLVAKCPNKKPKAQANGNGKGGKSKGKGNGGKYGGGKNNPPKKRKIKIKFQHKPTSSSSD